MKHVRIFFKIFNAFSKCIIESIELIEKNKNLFRPNNIYSVLFELGAFTPDEYCEPFSEKMFNLDKFKFKIVDHSSLKVT
jgi:hypothetical protein